MGGKKIEKKIGIKIKSLRHQKKLSVVDLAYELSISPMTVYHWERDKRTPSTKNLVALAKFFKKDINYFLGEEYAPT